MSIQWGIGDLLAVTKLAWDLYHNCFLVAREAPDDFRQLVNELGSLQGVLRNLRDDVNSDSSFVERLGENRKEMLERCLSSCFDTLRKLQELVIKYRKLGLNDGIQFWKKLKWVGKQDEISRLKSKIMVHTTNISLCMTTIGNSSLARIETDLARALERQERQDQMREEIDETTPLTRAKTTPGNSPDADDSNIFRMKRQFTETTDATLVDRAATTSPDTTPSVSEEDVDLGGRSAPIPNPRTLSLPIGRPNLNVNVERGWKAFPPSPMKSDDGVHDFTRKSFSGKVSSCSGELNAKGENPELAEVVEEAMQELFKFRQTEMSRRPLRIRPQDTVHKPIESLKQTFQSLAQDEMAFRRLNSKEWLQLGTWWLLKAKFHMQIAEKSPLTNAPESFSMSTISSTPSSQAYLDLLKASWILYDIVLNGDNLVPLQTNENRKLFYNLSDGISEEFNSFRSSDIPDQQTLQDQRLNCSIWEHMQPEEESETHDSDDLLLGSDNRRWITVEEDDAGDEGEDVFFRTFVDAAIGGRKARVRSKGFPYLLMLSTKEGESEPKVTIRNQGGSLCLTRDFTMDDLQESTPLKGRGTSTGSEPLMLNFGVLKVVVAFSNDNELREFMHKPTKYFEAVKRREPRQLAKATESLIYKSSVEVVEQLKTSTMRVMSRKHKWTSCDLRILETTCKEGWRTTRRFVISSSASEDQPWCTEFFLPLSRVQVSREGLGRQVTVKWSDVSHEKYDRTDGKYHTIYTHVYDDNNPNIAFSLLFRNQADADSFQNTILTLSSQPVYAWFNSPETGYVYDVYDTEPIPRKYKAILLILTRLNWTYGDLFYMYRDTDFDYDHEQTRVRFPQIYYIDYISTHVDKLYKPEGVPQFSHCEKKLNNVPIEFNKDSVSRAFMSSLTNDFELIFSRRAYSITSKTPSRFGSNRSGKGPAEVQLWRKGNSTRLLTRWGDSVEDKWMSIALEKTMTDLPKDSNRACFSRVEFDRGRKIDMANLVARDPRENSEAKKTGPLTITFSNFRDRDEFDAALNGKEIQIPKIRTPLQELMDME